MGGGATCHGVAGVGDYLVSLARAGRNGCDDGSSSEPSMYCPVKVSGISDIGWEGVCTEIFGSPRKWPLDILRCMRFNVEDSPLVGETN